MKQVATKTLTRADVERSDLSLSLAVTLSILLILISLFWMLFHVGGDRSTILFADIAYAVTALLGALWAFRVVFKSHSGPLRLEQRHELAWLLVGVGLCVGSLGGLYYTYLEYRGMSAFPSYADIGFTLFYLFTLVGLLIMPTSLHFRARMGIDAVITTLCLLGVSWFFVIGPTYFSQVAQANTPAEFFALLLGLSYPCWDLVLIFALLLLIQRRSQSALYPTFLLLGLSILSQTWADTAYAYTNIFTGTYQSGTATIDTFWFIGFLLMGLAALTQYNSLLHHSYQQHIHAPQETNVPHATSVPSSPAPLRYGMAFFKRLQPLHIYIPLALLLGLTVYAETSHDDTNSHDLVILTAIVGILVTVRYMLATRENERLSQEMARNHAQSELLRGLNVQLSAILDIEVLLERIVDIVTKQLGFDTAILLLLEDWTAETQSPFRVHASSSLGKMKKWRFQGNSFLSYLLLNGKAVDAHWNALAESTPTEIYLWQREEHISTTHFFPLLYQGHILGCLGVSNRGDSDLSSQQQTLIQAYVEQIAGIVEYTLLYKEAREHEIFAHAMANIATRLNAAVVEPEEIYQLICTEAANALQADFAILYVPDEPEEQDYRGKLVPLAAYEAGTLSQGKTWPLIRAHQTTVSAFHSLQPVLMRVMDIPSSPVQFSPRPPEMPIWRAQSSYQLQNAATLSLRERALREQQEQLVHRFPRQSHMLRQQEPLTLREKLAEHSVQTAILVPLLSAAEPVALLVVARAIPLGMYDRQSFGKESLSFAQDFAEQAAVAFTNAHLYQHLRSTHQRLQELDELKDQFMVTASHELRTPLTAVQGYIDLLTQYDDSLSAEERREFLQKTQRSCNELIILLNNVMDATRIEKETSIRPELLERINVREMIESVLVLIHPQVQQEHRLTNVYVPTHLFVLADPVRLRQVLMNLSVNALKYSPASTPITYTARYVDGSKGATPSIIIGVIDRGKGIAPDNQLRLFQRFSRLESEINSPIRGSGVGLYISRRLIELMGGRIWVESNGILGEGSAFYVQLPARL